MTSPQPSATTTSMRILVVGAGAIGLLVGGRLAQAGHDVTLVARPALADHLRQHGLRLIDATGSSQISVGRRQTADDRPLTTDRRPQTADDGPQTTDRRPLTADGQDHPSSIPKGGSALVHRPSSIISLQSSVFNPQSSILNPQSSFDWIALTVKAYDVAGAVEEIRAAFDTPPPIVTFQNGVGSEETAARILGETPIVAASITIPVNVPSLGVVEARKKGGIGLAIYDRPSSILHRPSSIVHRPSSALTSAGFLTRVYDDHRAMKWSKLLLNMIGNATSAILDKQPGDIFADPRLFRLEVAALREALAVMKAWDIPIVNLPRNPAVALAWAVRLVPTPLLQPILQRRVASGRGGKMPSLHLDLATGKGQSEVQFLNGAVVAWGQAKGVRTPVNQALTETLLELMAGRLAWDDFRQRPDALLTRVRQPL